MFRAGSQQPKAVPLSLVTRLEEIDCKKIELSNGRHLVQYRGQLMPLIRVSDEVRVRTEGAQPLLVFSDAGRSMGLVVDEIVDIVEDRLDIQVGSETMGVLGSAVIKGQATEIIDIGHFLPLAFEDWFRRKEMRPDALTRTLLFVDDSPFFRNMLVPVLKAAGYDVTAVGAADEALALVKKGQQVRRHRLRHRDARDERLRARRGDPRRRARRAGADHRALVDDLAGLDRAWPSGRLPRLRRQVRPPGSDRGAEGIDRRVGRGGLRIGS